MTPTPPAIPIYEGTVRFTKAGGHIHYTLFMKSTGSATSAKCGNFCTRDGEEFIWMLTRLYVAGFKLAIGDGATYDYVKSLPRTRLPLALLDLVNGGVSRTQSRTD